MVPCLLLSVFLSGCAGSELMVKRQAESEAKIEHLIQTAKKSEQRINELADQLQQRGEQLQASNADIKQLKDETRELRTLSTELRGRVTTLGQPAQTPKVEIVNPPTPGKSVKDPGPPTQYLKAFGLYSANNFSGAIAAFEEFMKSSPQSDYSANALYWVGECHYSLADYAKAKEFFQRVTENYPLSSKAPDALLKLGYTLLGMKEKDKATAIFEKVITSYPSNPAALKARERLTAH